MPRIQWTGLPPSLRDHLLERLKGGSSEGALVWLLRF